MKRILFLMILVAFSIPVIAQETAPKLDLIDFLKNMDWINIALVFAFSLAGGFLMKARTKLKQVSELLMMAYEFTDDKVLDKEERKKLINQVLLILGKKKTEQIQANVSNKVEAIKNKRPRHEHR